jgi:hypothetical protein
MTQEKRAYIETIQYGGFTQLADGTINPTEGYIVGGLVEPTTMDLHTDKLKELSVLTTSEFEEFKELWDKYHMLLDEHQATYRMYKYASGIGVGTWIHEGQIYFDLVQHLYNLDVATRVAKEHGEIAIYDCKNQKDILL